MLSNKTHTVKSDSSDVRPFLLQQQHKEPNFTSKFYIVGALVITHIDQAVVIRNQDIT